MQGTVLGADGVVGQHFLSHSLCDISLWKNGNLARIAYTYTNVPKVSNLSDSKEEIVNKVLQGFFFPLA